MKYSIKKPIYGFEYLSECEILVNDENISLLKSNCEDNIQIALLSDTIHDFNNIPASAKALLDIDEKSKLSLYYVVVLDKDLDKSTVALDAPIVVNEDNKTLAQYRI